MAVAGEVISRRRVGLRLALPSAYPLDRVFAVLDVVAEKTPWRRRRGEPAKGVRRHAPVLEGAGRELDDERPSRRIVAGSTQIADGSLFISMA
jgi:hypothetical protein